MSNRHYPAETPDELDLEEPDALDVRESRASRNGRKSSRDFLTDDDGSFGGSRPRRNLARRDDGKDQRRRVSQSREEPSFPAPRAPYNPGNGGFQRNRDATPPFASGGARVPERPRAPYPNSFDRNQGRPLNNPTYGSNPPDNRGPAFRPARPMNDSQPPRPPISGRDTPPLRDDRPAAGRPAPDSGNNRPASPGFQRPDIRQPVPQQGQSQPRNTQGGYSTTSRSGNTQGPTTPGGRPPFRRPDGPPFRPLAPRDDPRRLRRDDSKPAPERP